MLNIKKLFYLFWSPYGKKSFLLNLSPGSNVLDVGCGEESYVRINQLVKNISYYGIDIVAHHNNHFNNFRKSKIFLYTFLSNQFHNFYKKIPDIDYVVWSHNIEHCKYPYKTFKGISKIHKKNGLMYLSFPSSKSLKFPRRKGTLNFYDDKTHVNVIDYEILEKKLEKYNYKILYKNISYKPLIPYFFGFVFEPLSKFFGKNLPYGLTWYYYGFESIYILQKI